MAVAHSTVLDMWMAHVGKLRALAGSAWMAASAGLDGSMLRADTSAAAATGTCLTGVVLSVRDAPEGHIIVQVNAVHVGKGLPSVESEVYARTCA